MEILHASIMNSVTVHKINSMRSTTIHVMINGAHVIVCGVRVCVWVCSQLTVIGLRSESETNREPHNIKVSGLLRIA